MANGKTTSEHRDIRTGDQDAGAAAGATAVTDEAYADTAAADTSDAADAADAADAVTTTDAHTSNAKNAGGHPDKPDGSAMLLHACCGPCSLEPVRILKERGHTIHIYYSNSNIAPRAEYMRRLETIREWADGEALGFEEGAYDMDSWMERVARPWEESDKDKAARRRRCASCYRIRFEEAAAWAAENGYASLGTTLSVSPYQYTDLIEEELEAACAAAGIDAAFEDWRPYYDEATRRSRENGMYRQNYCGCMYSAEEARLEREERKAARAAERADARAKYLKEHADEIAAEKDAADRRREERRRYDAKRARQRAVLREMRGL